ncbi:MAG: porphobilinogen synthase [Candidatus Omnitrophica bacterium]|nr:porphobilinogen synthase [Candidatus Omnitrophota bacterium]
MAKSRYGVDIDSLVYPVFVRQGIDLQQPIPSMPGVYRFSPDSLAKEVDRLLKIGIKKILLFGITEEKDECGTAAYGDKSIVSTTIGLLKHLFPELIIMTDVCLCAYTSHGHCGILNRSSDDVLINKDKTLHALSEMALSHAAAGADYVAPSAMAEGQVSSIRKALDGNGFKETRIMGYSAKYASQFYGPFRDIADSAPRFGDRCQYQLGWTERERAFSKIEDDIREGADIVMVKPALAYLDIIREARDKFRHRLAAYNVSGEYAMIKAGAQSGYWDEEEAVFEVMTAIKRAGADIVITYHAPDIARWLNRGGVPQ